MSKKVVAENSAQVEVVENVVVSETSTVVSSSEAMAAIKLQLEEQLKNIAYKNEIANNREKFLQIKKELQKIKKHTDELKEYGFDSQDLGLVFKSRSYDFSFSISNIALIMKFIDCLDLEIDVKVKEIETKLMGG